MWIVERYHVLKNHRPYWKEIDGGIFYSALKRFHDVSVAHSWQTAQKVADYLEREYRDSPHRVVFKDVG